MRARTSWLTESEKRTVYEEALTLLERVGMQMAGSRAVARLAEAGARVDDAGGVVRLPAELVARCLEECPRGFVMAGLEPADDVLIGDGFHFCPSGTSAHTLDMETGDHRASTSDDLRAATIVLDETPELEVMWPTVTSNDIPVEQRRLREYFIMLNVTRKHLKHGVDRPEQIAPLKRLFEVVAGDMDRFRARPRISLVCCTASPLTVNGELLDLSIELAGCGAPVCVYPMPIAGATAPVTVAGTLTLNVAEFLAVATAMQTAHPGSRLIMGCGASVLDMRTTTYSFGALEGALMSAALTEIGHFLGVPVLCPGLATDAKYPGIQAGYEKALKGLTVAGAGADLITGGMGLLNGANTLYLPQIVVDAEIAAMIRRLLGETEISPAATLGETIARVGIGGHFLKERETKRRIRTGEHFFPTVSTRLSYEMWQADGRREDDIARARVADILATRADAPSYLTPEQRRELAEICRV